MGLGELSDMSDNEKDAKYMLEDMVGNVIMVMGRTQNGEVTMV